MATIYQPNPEQPLVASENLVGLAMVAGLPKTGDPSNRRCPIDLEAVSWPGGKRIDLIWTNPDDITRIIIKRGRNGHSAFLLDDKDVIYDGPPIEHFIDGVKIVETLANPNQVQSPPELEIGVPATGVALEEDTYYYYTVYMTVKPEPVGVYDFGLEAKTACQVTGLSILDFVAYRDENGNEGQWYGEYLYKQFSAATRERDLANAKALGRGDRGWFQDFCLFAQGALNLYRGHARALRQLGDVGRTPAGLVGKAFDQPVILAAWARRFNIQPERRILDPEILRRIAKSMIFLYKEKGTCPGLVDWIKVLTLWDSECFQIGNDNIDCNPIFIETWDKQAIKVTVTRQWSVLTSSPGQTILPGAGLTPDVHNGSLANDSLWNQYRVLSNTADTVVLDDEDAEFSPEELITVTNVDSLGGNQYLLTATRDSGNPVLNDGEFDQRKVLDAGNTLLPVIATVANDPGVGTSTLLVESLTAPVTGAAAAALDFITGATFADRDPIIQICLYTRCPTFLYDPLMDIELRDIFDGSTINPHDILYSGGSLLGVPFRPGDTVINIPDVALHVGSSTSISGNVLTDTSADFGPPGALNQARLNPNQNARYYFEIESNTPTTITVKPLTPDGAVTLENVSVATSRYAVLGFEDWRRYEIMSRLTYLFLPVTTRLFIFMT